MDNWMIEGLLLVGSAIVAAIVLGGASAVAEALLRQDRMRTR